MATTRRSRLQLSSVRQGKSTVYSLGLPFLLAALFTGALLTRLRVLGRAGRNLQRIAGGLLIAMGLLMVTGQLERMAYWLLETFPALGAIG